MWYEFNQNNSGGSFIFDEKDGIGKRVWVEANSADEANERAESLGIYFNGVDRDIDCPCCGDRWYDAWGEGADRPEINEKYDFNWHDKIFIHPLNEDFYAITIDNYKSILKEKFGEAE